MRLPFLFRTLCIASIMVAKAAEPLAIRSAGFIDRNLNGPGEDYMLPNSSPNVNFFRNLGKNSADQWAFRDEGPVSTHVLAGHATKPTVMRTTGVVGATLLIGAEDGFFYQLPNPRAK